ncbi:MAG: winged helix-turn-helix domain-containing protein [Candidatus Lokiarchaeota archaeon]|nr:winged helix-turn-helix domain-containing protein [Candidatus Harpocratesius repetitus]
MTEPNSEYYHGPTPVEERTIKDPKLVVQVMHAKKQLILKQIFSRALTIQDLKKKTGMNPGTIKRHLDELMHHDLVYVERIERNTYNILMKFYRTTAKKFIINFILPDDFPS